MATLAADSSATSGPTTGQQRIGNKLTISDDTDESEPDQTYPMMPHDENVPRSVSQQKMADDQPKPPTGMLTWIGFGCCIFALTTLCISFSSPYWIQRYPMSFNRFKNIGLWEVCFDHYMHHRDQSQEIYSGCWWVFEKAMYNKLKEWLLPPWFIACQVMSTMSLLVVIATNITVALVFLHCCPIINHEYMQSYAIFVSSALMFLSTLITLVVGTVFALSCGDRNWMPRPDLNLLSWGYGFFIVHGMACTVAGVCFYVEARRCYYELMDREDEYAMLGADMEVDAYLQQQQAAEMSGYPPSYASSGQLSFEKSGYDQSAGGYQKPGYGQSQSSFGQPSMEKPSYGQSQSSYGQPSMEKPSYGQSQSSYGQPSMEKPSYGQSQSSYGGGPTTQHGYGYPSQKI